MYGSRLFSLVGRRHSPMAPPNRDGCRYQLRHKCPGRHLCCLSSMYNLNSQFSCRATQMSHTRHQPLGPNNESNRDVTHKTSTTVSDNDNTETSHTTHQPLCLTMTATQTSHTRQQPLGPTMDEYVAKKIMNSVYN